MKTKSITATLLSVGFSLIASHAGASTLLFGFTSFDNTSSAQTATSPNTTETGFTASVSKGTASGNSGGSNDTTYGPTLTTGGSGGNGFIALSTNTATVFTLTNDTAVSYTLESLYFDIIRSQASTAGAATVNYNNDGGGVTAITNQVLFDEDGTISTNFSAQANATDANPGAGTAIDANYNDKVGRLAGVILEAGTSITFSFATLSSNMRLDNIAVVGFITPSTVPEPGSVLAMGCLLATGLGLRSRSRGPVQAA